MNRLFVRKYVNYALFWLVAGMHSIVAAAPVVTDYDAVPPLLAESAKPMVMLAVSKDHQLFYKAFTDYDDLDADGVVDTTYKNAFEYAGYFDSYKCYEYDTVSGLFNPVSITVDKYCSGSKLWSGNFLNWATMTRVDEVRKVLYGGLRSVDTATDTVLERSYLANDAHSFAKFYDGSDLEKLTPFTLAPTCGAPPGKSAPGYAAYKACEMARGITLCNTTRYTGLLLSQAVTSPPVMRAVNGNYSLWAANERFQCIFDTDTPNPDYKVGNGNDPDVTGILAYSKNPPAAAIAAQRDGTTVGDYSVKVKVCVSNALLGQEDCKAYPSGNLKPIGILQQFGDDGSALFGLMTGTYKKNKSGGVLRKNIASFTDEVNYSTDGTFKAAPASGGIVNSLNQLRLVNYNFNSGKDGTYEYSDNCKYGKNSFSNGECTNWGNPFSELVLECYRYLAGKTPDGAFDADDTSYLPGLTRQTTWSNPQTTATACANLNVIGFNASTISYDGDELGKITDLATAKTAQQLTKTVGDGENITGKYFFIGESGGAGAGDNNQICTAKMVSDLGLVEGTCPDAPRLDGSYRLAGIAHQAHVADIRPDITDRQIVSTYGVTLSPALPKITVTNPSNNKSVSILPACRNSAISGNCAIVDFKIVSQVVTATEASGTFYVNWEDSEQGGDYDQDMSGIISYVLTTTGLTITSDVFGESTGNAMGFGFVVSGTTEDGFHALSGINNYTGYECTNCTGGQAAASKTFTLGQTSISGALVSLLEQPLFYAAKWGGFRDSNASNTPDLVTEWDRKNNSTGATGSDGVPDNYFFAIDPKQLKSNLNYILVSILERTSSGTSAALVSNTGAGEGALFQALYNPRVSDFAGTSSVSWVGALNAFFIDRWGNMRDDSAAPYGQLTSSDSILDIYYDPYSKRTYYQRYQITSTGGRGAPVGPADDILKVKSVWSANDALASVADYTTQRAYTANASTGRYIFTGIDRTGDGQIGWDAWLNEVEPFVPATFPNGATDNQFRLLGLTTANKDEAPNLINFIRGQEGIAGYRNRTVDFKNTGTAKPWLLGDIVNSSPVSVGRPNASYDVSFGDGTYLEYKLKYEKRRQVVYVGSNDGMLHAFNAGFFDANTSSYALSSGKGEVEHPLGAELWAYVPYNLLPHLQWLSKADYPHVYYMDGPVKSYDVNIFTPDEVHPGGWGTIIVAGMRFGGGDFSLDPNSDPDGVTTDDITTRSGFVVMDVTDPEKPPVLIGEIANYTLGFASAEPAVMKFRAPNSTDGSYTNPDINNWYLLLGSGPSGYNAATKAKALNTAETSGNASILVYDLKSKTIHSSLYGIQTTAFIGGITATDWNQDFSDDAFYFGTVAGTPSAPSGKIYRGTPTVTGTSVSFATSLLMNTNQAVSAPPTTLADHLHNYWVYFGTGRFYVVEDNASSSVQSYYAVKEPKSAGVMTKTTVATTSLINTTDVQSFTDGSIRSKSTSSSPMTLNNGASVATFYDVADEVSKTSGWFYNFTRTRARNTTKSVIADQSLVFSEYQPSGLKCQPEGQGYLNAPHLFVGVPGMFAPLGKDSSVKFKAGELVNSSVSLGLGAPSAPQIHQNSNGVRNAVVQTSTGQISWQTITASSLPGRRESWREIPINW